MLPSRQMHATVLTMPGSSPVPAGKRSQQGTSLHFAALTRLQRPRVTVIFLGTPGLSGGRVDAQPVAEPEVIPRVVEVLATGLLRARRCAVLEDVGPEQVLGAEERTGRELEDQELIRRCSVGEARRRRERRQADAGRRAGISAGLLCGWMQVHPAFISWAGVTPSAFAAPLSSPLPRVA